MAELRQRRSDLAQLPSAELLCIPDEVAEILAWEREIGLSETSVEIERNSWILLSAAYPSMLETSLAMKRTCLADEDYRRLVLAMDRAIDWDRDDPRLLELAEVSMAVLERLYPAELAHEQAEQWTGTDDVTVGLLNEMNEYSSPAWQRLYELVGELDPGARLPGLLSGRHQIPRPLRSLTARAARPRVGIMPLFGRKKTEDVPVRTAWDPLPLPPPARPDGLRTMEDHRDYLLSCTEELPAFGQQLLDAVDLASCEEIVSPISLPGFDNTAMDGYAVRAQDVAAASPEDPVRLPVVGEVAAGQAAPHRLSPGTAMKIMTGAPVPTGADAIVAYESTDRGAADVEVYVPSEVGPAHPPDRRGRGGRSARVPGRRPARPPLHRPAGRHRPGVGAGAAAPSGGGDRHRLRAGGAGSPAAERLPDLRLELLPARRRGARGRRPGVPGGTGQRRSRAGARADQRPAGPGRSHPDHRWGEPRGLRRRQVRDARARRHRVRPGRDAAGQAAGLRSDRQRPDPDDHAAGQPGERLRVLRGVRASGDQEADGSHALHPDPGQGSGLCTR